VLSLAISFRPEPLLSFDIFLGLRTFLEAIMRVYKIVSFCSSYTVSFAGEAFFARDIP
jgi:hypothetical protein